MHYFIVKLKIFVAILLILCKITLCYASDDEFAEFDNPKQVIPDPWEKINRKTHNFNSVIDKYAVLPVARTYINITTPALRLKVSSFLRNFNTPSDAIIGVFQGDTQGAAVLAWRFIINTTFGIFGVFDVAAELGLPDVQKSFGDLLGSYGFSMGNYIVLPIFGPSYSRYVMDFPVNILLTSNANGNRMPIPYKFISNGTLYEALKNKSLMGSITGLSVINIRSKLIPITDDIDNSSIDTYRAYRDMYTQFVQYNVEKRLKTVKEGIFYNRDVFWQHCNINTAINDTSDSNSISNFS